MAAAAGEPIEQSQSQVTPGAMADLGRASSKEHPLFYKFVICIKNTVFWIIEIFPVRKKIEINETLTAVVPYNANCTVSLVQSTIA